MPKGPRKTTGATQLLFQAISDPTRRTILELLADNGQMTATEIYDNFTFSHPSVSLHLQILRRAELVSVEKSAQRHIYSLNPKGIRDLQLWVSRYASEQIDRLERLADLVDERPNQGK